MDDQRLGDDLLDRHARIERAEGVLEDRLGAAAKAAQRRVGRARDVLAVEEDAAGGGLVQPQHEIADRALARAGLADEAQHLAGLDRERDAVDRLQAAGRRAAGCRAWGNAA